MPLLIAECCQNHNGDRQVLRRMVHAAAEAGADYVKIQSIRSDELTRRERFEHGAVADNGEVAVLDRPFTPELARLRGLDLSPDDEIWFVEECHRAGVKSMTTVFTRGVVRQVDAMGFDAVKIASYDCSSYPLLDDVSARWRRVFMSTGCADDDEVAEAVGHLAVNELHLLHCVTVYPTPLKEIQLQRIAALRDLTQLVGFSDHTAPAATGVVASMAALALGASVVERHFTVLGPEETRDGPVSIDVGGLEALRRFADLDPAAQAEQLDCTYSGWRALAGPDPYVPSPVERRNRDYYRGRFASQVQGRTVWNWERHAAFDGELPPLRQ